MVFGSVLNLSTLNGSNGFAINGVNTFYNSGGSVSNAGDVNGDGTDDLIIGAVGADPNGRNYSGQSYVVFGSTKGFASSFNLSSLNGSNGFALNGVNTGDFSGWSVSSSGDVNGDGTDDLIIGAHTADPNGRNYSGQSYVVFGSTNGFASSFNLSSLNGSKGFALNGVNAYDYSGSSVNEAGDVNGDGTDDLIIGAPRASSNGRNYSGQSYVVFGSTNGFASNFNLSSLNGSNGFVLNGVNAYDWSGWSVSNAGDVNGDGTDDLIIGARYADPNGDRSGQSYVVFGSTNGFASKFNLSSLNGSNGFALNGVNKYDWSGGSVSGAGDVNGDGTDDLLIGARYADLNGDRSGQSYVVFGSTNGFASIFNLSSLNGSNGFTLNGVQADDWSGNPVSGAGDVNGDGTDDLIIGAIRADSNGIISGQSYVVFGSTNGFASKFNLSSLNGSNGFALNGINQYDWSGGSVSGAGDVNGDGTDDLLIGAPWADPNGNASGQSYVVFGQSAAIVGDNKNNLLNGTSTDDNIQGLGGNDTLNGLPGNDSLDGGIGNDSLDGGGGNDSISGGQGYDYIISGLGDDVINGDTGTDYITSGKGNDLLRGEADKDTLIGEAGNDTLYGGYANDYVDGGEGNDYVDGGTGENSVLDGKDTVLGGNGDDQLYADYNKDLLGGGNGNDSLFGGVDEDRLYGDQGNDSLVGGLGIWKDQLFGGGGNDTLNGGDGNDLLQGDAGKDFFLWSGKKFNRQQMGVDKIQDFVPQSDKLELSKVTFSTISSKKGNGFSISNEFAIVTTDIAAQKSSADIVYNKTNDKLFYNQNGITSGFGEGGVFVTFANNPNISATDFIIV